MNEPSANSLLKVLEEPPSVLPHHPGHAQPVPPPPDDPSPAARPWPSRPSAGRRSSEILLERAISRSRPASSPSSSTATWSGPWSSIGTRSRASRTRPGSLFEAMLARPRLSLPGAVRLRAQGRPGGVRRTHGGLLVLRPGHPPPQSSAGTPRSCSIRTSRRGSGRPRRPGASPRSWASWPSSTSVLVELPGNLEQRNLLATTFFSNFGEIEPCLISSASNPRHRAGSSAPATATWPFSAGDRCIVESELGGDLAVVVDETSRLLPEPQGRPAGRPGHPQGHATRTSGSSSG